MNAEIHSRWRFADRSRDDTYLPAGSSCLSQRVLLVARTNDNYSCIEEPHTYHSLDAISRFAELSSPEPCFF